jgi:peptidoglycan/LPS O-acetylase OafA/YrhL
MPEFIHSFPASFVLDKLFLYVSFGEGAVLAFFVISGFCIHYSYFGLTFNTKMFYVRRFKNSGLFSDLDDGRYARRLGSKGQ